MGRWSHLDPDDERLPEGICRVGYDADTQSYTFQDRSGAYWESKPGRRYGPLRRVYTSPTVQTVPVLEAPHIARVDGIVKATCECDMSEEEAELCPGIEAESQDHDVERCGEKHQPPCEKKHVRNVTGGFSRLAGYFRDSLHERKTTRRLRDARFPLCQRDSSMSPRSRVLHRAVTFDEILSRRADVKYCTHCGKSKGG